MSPDLQRERIEAWATYRGFQIAGWYVDVDRPAKEGDVRPEFDRLMVDAAAGHFQMVAVARLNRFARSVTEAARRYSELRQLGVGLASVTEDIDTSTASGAFMQNVLFAMAEFESKRIGEEWRSVHANRRGRGLAHVTRGVYGFRVDGAVIAGVDDAEARAVRGIYQRRAAGQTYKQIRDWLHAEGHRPPRGQGEYFGTTTLHWILRNPLYAGLVRNGDDLVDGRHEGIVSRALWESVQDAHPRVARLARHKAGLVSGLLVCESCGYRMIRGSNAGKAVYRCRPHRYSHDCERPAQIQADIIEPYVEQAFKRAVDPRRMPKGGVHRLRRKRWADRQEKAANRVADLNRAIDRLTDERYVMGSLSAEEYERQLRRLTDEREQVQTDADEAAALARQQLPRVVPFSEWTTLPLDAQRRILRAAVEKITVRSGRGDPAARVEIEWL